MILNELHDSSLGNQSLIDYFRWRWVNLHDLDGFFEEAWDEYDGGDYYSSSHTRVRGFADYLEIKHGSWLRHEYGREIPAFFWLEPSPDTLLPANSWIIHYTDYPLAIANDGFKFGVQKEDDLAFTFDNGIRNKSRGPGYNFGYLLDGVFDPDQRTSQNSVMGSYGDHAVIFQSSGLQCYHIGDQEKQVIFYGPSVKRNIIPLMYVDDGWYGPSGPVFPTLKKLVQSRT